MLTALNPASLLRSTDTDLDKITIKTITQVDVRTVLCCVETCFLHELFEDEEEEHDLLLYWDDELNILTLEMSLLTGIPVTGYGWALDELNLHAADERWTLQGRLECPEHDDLPQLLAFIGSWKFNVPVVFSCSIEGRQMFGSIVRQMLQTLCVDTLHMEAELTNDYADLKVM